jgi:Immunity protein 51
VSGTDPAVLAPVRPVEYDHAPGSYALMLDEHTMVETMDTFDKTATTATATGGKASRDQRFARTHRRSPIGSTTTPEAGMFVARSSDRAALVRLGSLLQEATRDRALLAELLQTGEPDWFD